MKLTVSSDGINFINGLLEDTRPKRSLFPFFAQKTAKATFSDSQVNLFKAFFLKKAFEKKKTEVEKRKGYINSYSHFKNESQRIKPHLEGYLKDKFERIETSANDKNLLLRLGSTLRRSPKSNPNILLHEQRIITMKTGMKKCKLYERFRKEIKQAHNLRKIKDADTINKSLFFEGASSISRVRKNRERARNTGFKEVLDKSNELNSRFNAKLKMIKELNRSGGSPSNLNRTLFSIHTKSERCFEKYSPAQGIGRIKLRNMSTDKQQYRRGVPSEYYQ